MPSKPGTIGLADGQILFTGLAIGYADMDAAVRQNSPGFFTRLGKSLSAGWYGVLEVCLQVVKVWPLWLLIVAIVLAYRRLRKK